MEFFNQYWHTYEALNLMEFYGQIWQTYEVWNYIKCLSKILCCEWHMINNTHKLSSWKQKTYQQPLGDHEDEQRLVESDSDNLSVTYIGRR